MNASYLSQLHGPATPFLMIWAWSVFASKEYFSTIPHPRRPPQFFALVKTAVIINQQTLATNSKWMILGCSRIPYPYGFPVGSEIGRTHKHSCDSMARYRQLRPILIALPLTNILCNKT
jgi:hypothetical protein